MPAGQPTDLVEGSDEEDDGLRSSRRRVAARAHANGGRNFDLVASWNEIEEGQDGTISGAVKGLLESSKRQRLLKDTTPVQRGIIRHLILIIDISVAMDDKDMRPTRFHLTLNYVQTFISEFFEQNPISQLGIVGMHDGMAIRISDMSGNPADHFAAITKIRPPNIEPKGNPSLQNALEMARASLFHAPQHGTREILLIFGALHTTDPGDIHTTITQLASAHIRAAVIGLAAQVAICAELVSKTNDGSTERYHVIMHEQHYRELLLSYTTPPVHYATPSAAMGIATNSLLMMGFPSRTVSPYPTLCACHTRPSRSGYLCSRCNTKVCSLPSECPVCGLTLILSTHLARSYHHLFPLLNWMDVPWSDAHRSQTCFGCGKGFPNARQHQKAAANTRGSTDEGSSRYECPACHKHFCIDCDLFAHEVVHNCPGCQSMRMETSLMGETELPQQEGMAVD